MIRGNHEDIRMSKIFGFGEECAIRLGEDIRQANSVFQKINEVLEYLPMAALIEDKILCIHSGLGKQVCKLSDIE